PVQGLVWSASADKTLRSWASEEAPRPSKEDKQRKLAVAKTATMQVLPPEDKKADAWKARHVVLDAFRLQLYKKPGEREAVDDLALHEVQAAGAREVAKRPYCFGVTA